MGPAWLFYVYHLAGHCPALLLISIYQRVCVSVCIFLYVCMCVCVYVLSVYAYCTFVLMQSYQTLGRALMLFRSVHLAYFYSLSDRALLHFLDPDKFKSKDDFVHNYKNLSSFNEIEVQLYIYLPFSCHAYLFIIFDSYYFCTLEKGSLIAFCFRIIVFLLIFFFIVAC